LSFLIWEPDRNTVPEHDQRREGEGILFEMAKASGLWMRRNGPDEIVATEILPGDIAHVHTDIPG
jgi:hypothetical protein